MKRLVVFALLVVVLDRGLGTVMAHLYLRTLTGERSGLLNYVLLQQPDILILGSSRAQHQVMPAVFRERLSMTAFNAGLKGHDFLYSVMLFDLWRGRHRAPRALLIQIDIESLLDRPTEFEAAQIFAPFLDESRLVRETLYAADPFKRLEYWSRAYRYNGKVFSIAKNLFAHQDSQFDGFIPTYGQLNPSTAVMLPNALDQDVSALELARRPYSVRKLRYLRDLAARSVADGTLLVLFHTPLYSLDPVAHRLWTERLRGVLAEMPSIAFVDICGATHPDVFANRPDIYSDSNHLNAEGSIILSRMLADELRLRLHAPAGLATLNQPSTHRHPVD